MQCYITLYYYSYVNTHMFVAKDTSYQELYFNYRQNPEDCEDSGEKDWQESESQSSVSEKDIEDINVSMVSSLLDDE